MLDEGKQKIENIPFGSFHDGVGARLRTVDVEHSGSFETTQGLRQGCVLSLLLFKVFLATALHVVLVRFGRDEAIIRGLVQLNDAGADRGAGVVVVRAKG